MVGRKAGSLTRNKGIGDLQKIEQYKKDYLEAKEKEKKRILLLKERECNP